MTVNLDVSVSCLHWTESVCDVLDICRRAGAAALGVACPGAEHVELGILLADDARVAELNKTFRDRNGATNVLSFVNDRSDIGNAVARETGYPMILGDVILAFETVAAEADDDGKPIADHLAHLVVHGVLHLLGHDHQNDRDTARMQALECAALATLDIADPYLGEQASVA